MTETVSVQDQNQSNCNMQINEEKLNTKDQVILATSQNNTADTLPVRNNNQEDSQKNKLESNSKPSNKPKRSNVISPRLSYWINVQRCLMCIIVLVSHITPKSYYEKSVATALIPHPFVANGRACVRVFFAFAAIFSFQSMLGLYEKHKNSTKEFTKAFLFQYVKRYFSTHAVLFVFGLGYAPFLYYVFGENGRDVYYNWRDSKRYWLVWYLPVYLPWRPSETEHISMSAWFSQQLVNVEFFFYCFYFLGYFFKKMFVHQGKWGVSFIIIVTISTYLLQELAPGCNNMSNYCCGVACYLLRLMFCSTDRGKKIINFAYCKDTKILVARWILSIFFIYLWLFMQRTIVNEYAHVPFCVFLMFDLIPFPRFTAFWQKVIDEISRLLMPIYIIHHPFLKEAAPRYFPYVTALTPSIENNHSWINAFSSWMYLCLFGMLSYPLWFMQRPLEVLPVWLKSLKDKTHLKNKKQFQIDLILSFTGLTAAVILIALAQSDVFGHGHVDLPPLWK
ncbi:Conserved_hypothetical protein [Hexamita inflata]|uniref:Uncharacterized protein n=1 Tax=Hexamita inflata TaxID=28002 RepID=A0AA86QLP0_9EUKA|nr:Conserved hypothetical protein [Hexamita inflata]